MNATSVQTVQPTQSVWKHLALRPKLFANRANQTLFHIKYKDLTFQVKRIAIIIPPVKHDSQALQAYQ